MMSAILAYEEFVFAFGSEHMNGDSPDPKRVGLAICKCLHCGKSFRELIPATSCCLGRRRTARDTCIPASSPQTVNLVQTKITNDLFVLFSQEELRLYRLHRRVRGFNKSGRRDKKVS